MSEDAKTNRLSIYLIKFEFNTADKILKDINRVTAHELSNNKDSLALPTFVWVVRTYSPAYGSL